MHRSRTPRLFRPFVEILEKRLTPATVRWVNDGDGFWDVAGNWRDDFTGLNGVPGLLDMVVIDRGAANPTITVRSGNQRILSLVSEEALQITGGSLHLEVASQINGPLAVTGGTLRADVSLPLAGTTTWSNGNLDGTFLNQGTFQFAGNGAPTFVKSTLDNRGTVVVTGSPTLSHPGAFGNFGTIHNRAGAAFELRGSLATDTNINFVNEGVVRSTAGAGEAVWSGPFRNEGGSFDLAGGQFILANSNNILNGGHFSLTGAAVFDLTRETRTTLSGDFTGTGSGRVRLASGTLDVPGSAMFDFTEGLFHWTGGILDSGTLTNRGFFQISGTGARTFNASQIVNTGQVIVTGSVILQATGGFGNDGTFHNRAGATFENRGSLTASRVDFINEGLVRQVGENVGGDWLAPFHNRGGTIEVRDGRLTIGGQNSVSTGGHFVVDTGAVLDLTASASTSFAPVYGGNYTGSGVGRVELENGIIEIPEGGATFDFPEGLFHWTGGILGTGTLTNRGFFQISGSGARTFRTSQISNVGRIIVTGAVELQATGGFGNDGTFHNRAGATFENRGSLTASRVDFINEGLVRQVGENVGGDWLAPFHNRGGTIEVRDGRLTIGGQNSVSTGGHFVVDAEAVLDLTATASTSHAPVYGGNYTGSGAGRVELENGLIEIPEGGTTFDYPEGLFHWTGGSIDGTADGSVLTNRGSFQISGDGNPQLSATLDNVGHIRILDAPVIGHNGANALKNLPGGLLEFRGDSRTSSGLAIHNSGTVRRSGQGSASVDGAFHNAGGLLEVESGRLRLTRDGMMDGATIRTNPGGVFEFANTSRYDLAGTLTGSGGGRVELTGLLRGTAPGTPDPVLDFPEGLLHWLGANITSNITNAGHITLDGDESHEFSRGSLTNRGTMVHQGMGPFLLFNTGNGASLINEGLYEIRGDGDLGIADGGGFGTTERVVNRGTFRKTSGIGESSIEYLGTDAAFVFDNQGTTEVLSGTLRINEPVAQVGGGALTGGTWHIGPFSTLNLQTAGQLTRNAGHVILEGPGSTFANLDRLSINEGTFRLAGGRDFTTVGGLTNRGNLEAGPASDLTVSGALTVDASAGMPTVAVVVGGTPDSGQFGRLVVQGEARVGGATLAVSLTGGFAPTTGDVYEIMTYPSLTEAFSTVTTPPSLPADVQATRVILNAQGSPPDLLVASVEVPTGPLTPGMAATFGYVIANAAGTPLAGSWTDSVYLSRDPSLTADDQLLGRVLHEGGVAANGTYHGTLSAFLPSVFEGTYFVLVVANSRAEAGESRRDNNVGFSRDRVAVEFPTLTFGEPTTGTLAPGEDRIYRLNTPAGVEALLSAEFDSASVGEIYVRHGALPSPGAADRASTNLAELRRQLILDSAPSGSYFILLRGRPDAPAATPFRLLAERDRARLDRVTPSHGQAESEALLTITGTNFTRGTRVELVPPNGPPVQASNVEFVSPTRLHARVPLPALRQSPFPDPPYDLRVTTEAEVLTLEDAFSVESPETSATGLRFSISGRGRVRAGTVGRLTIAYENVDTVNRQAMLLYVEAEEGTRLRLAGTTAWGDHRLRCCPPTPTDWRAPCPREPAARSASNSSLPPTFRRSLTLSSPRSLSPSIGPTRRRTCGRRTCRPMPGTSSSPTSWPRWATPWENWSMS